MKDRNEKKARGIVFRALLASIITMGKKLPPEEQNSVGRFIYGKKMWEKIHPETKADGLYQIVPPLEAENALEKHLDNKAIQDFFKNDDHTIDDHTIE